MSVVTVNINERTSAGRALLEYLKTLGVIVSGPKKEVKKTGMDLTLEAINELKKGEGTKCKDFEDYKKKVSE